MSWCGNFVQVTCIGAVQEMYGFKLLPVPESPVTFMKPSPFVDIDWKSNLSKGIED